MVLTALISCTSSDEIAFEDIELVCVSGRQEMIYVYFLPPEGVECEGVHIEKSGNVRTLTFLRADGDSSSLVSSAAVLSADPPWEGSLRVTIEIPKGISQNGGELILKYSGDESYTDTMTIFPPED